MYPVNFTEKMSVNLTHAHTVCTRPSLSQRPREGPGDEASKVIVRVEYKYIASTVLPVSHLSSLARNAISVIIKRYHGQEA